MLGSIASAGISMALNGVKEKVVNPNLEGIGVVKEISFRDKKLHLKLVLDGLEDKVIEISCSKVTIAPDGSSVGLSGFSSNMPFAENALNRFAPKAFSVPDGAGRIALVAARKVLGLAGEA